MKTAAFLIFSLLSITNASKDNECTNLNYVYDSIYCSQIELSSEISLEFIDSYTKLFIEKSTGKIGNKTFSSLIHLKELTLKDPRITQVQDGVLCSPPNLERIFLINVDDATYFPTLTGSLLSNCSKIKYLAIKNLEIEPSAFINMINLEELHLHGQKISHSTEDYLQPLKNLKTLEFRDSEIKAVDAGAICLSPKLEKLTMFRNILPTVTKPMFQNCNHIKQFSYFSHELVRLEEEAFNGFINSTFIDLRDLPIKHLTKVFLTGFNNAKYLTIIKSNITNVDTDAFTGFNELEGLHLIDSSISTIDPDVLSFMPKLQSLDLQRNYLASVDNFKHPNLYSLKVDYNKIAAINTTAVIENLPKLSLFYLDCNLLTKEHVDALKQELSHKKKYISISFGSTPCNY